MQKKKKFAPKNQKNQKKLKKIRKKLIFLQYLCGFMLINAKNAQIKPFWRGTRLVNTYIHNIRNGTAIQCVYFLVA